jgi:hypothetical protein
MFKKLLLFLSYISVSSQFFMTPKCILSFQNKTTNATTQYYPSLTSNKEYDTESKQINCNDALTMFKIWATLFVFTFPIILFPYHKEN